MALTIEIADLVVTRRTVDVPSVCPHCDTNLVTDNGEMTVDVTSIDQVVAHSGISVIDPDAEDEEDRLTDPFLEEYETEGSDQLAYQDVECHSCHKSVLDQPGQIREGAA